MYYYKGQWFDKPTDAIAFVDPDLYLAVQEELQGYIAHAEALNLDHQNEIDELIEDCCVYLRRRKIQRSVKRD